LLLTLVHRKEGVSKLMEEHTLPKFDYYIDESDPDIVILRRQGGTFVAAFSARGATKEGAPRSCQGGLLEADGGQRGPFER
jgi:hypothetical protein